MKRILYISAATSGVTDADIADILAASRRNNATAGVTGMLLHLDGGFLQILEGPEAAVDGTYRRISGDGRHKHIVTLWSEPAEQRAFRDWSMGFDRVRADDPRWTGAFAIDPRRPDATLASGAGAEIVALMRSFYENAAAVRFA